MALADGMVWSELAAAFPGSGGTYHFYDAAYGDSRVGRLLKFVFVWQFLFSGPLEVASGAIGMTQYIAYFYPSLGQTVWNWGAFIPYVQGEPDSVASGRDVPHGAGHGPGLSPNCRGGPIDGRALGWDAGDRGWVIVTGLTHFDAARAFDFPEHAWRVDRGNAMKLGMVLAIAMYDFLGYYQVCYLGDEVADPSRTIPRSILISVIAVAPCLPGHERRNPRRPPWREVVKSKHVASDLMLRTEGPRAAGVVTMMIIWTALASVFAALLGYSRIPYAAARAGHFFKFFAATHPTGQFPHRSLLLIGRTGESRLPGRPGHGDQRAA